MQKVPIKDAREHIASLIEQVYVGKQQFVITKFGKPKAFLIPVDSFSPDTVSKPLPAFGSWKKNKTIKQSNTWVTEQRNQWDSRI